MSAPVWTSDMVAELARLRREGRTARQIAHALSARFRVAVSRSAVCGLVYRLNQAAAGERAPRAQRPSLRRSQAGRLAKPGPRWTAQEDATLRRLRDEGPVSSTGLPRLRQPLRLRPPALRRMRWTIRSWPMSP
jgi:hypothetical protein